MDARDQDITLEGDIENIRYETDDKEFQVVVLRHNDTLRTTVVLRGAGVLADEHVRVKGPIKRHASGEQQLEAHTIDRLLPSTKDGLVRFLSSGHIPGVGESYARKIVDHFGEQTIHILSETPQKLQDVPGIGKKRAERIAEAWESHEGIRSVMVFLQSHGISAAFANRIYRHYGQKAAAILRANPYQLARDVRGIGFFAADAIAQKAGTNPNDPRRISAAIEHALHEARVEGHVYLPQDILVERCLNLLRQPDADVPTQIQELVLAQRLTKDHGGEGPGDAIYLRAKFEEENELALLLHDLNHAQITNPPIDERALHIIQRGFAFPLSKEQQDALVKISNAPVAILTGGPGTGKTTIVRALVNHATNYKATVVLAAPTGRAAWRITESTGHPASTIHRLLEFDPRERTFLRDKITPLDADLVIIDESSMLDLSLGRALLRAIKPSTQLILVGDADQLPPVGAGEVFADIIASGAITTANLNRVFRQGDRSPIVIASHEVREGRMPVGEQNPNGEFFFIRRDRPNDALNTIAQLVSERIPRAFELHPMRDIQILAPTHRGELGCTAINQEMQQKFCADQPFVTVRGTRFHLGEKVMQTRNNYELEVFNGDIGFITQLDAQNNTVTVGYEGRSVTYKKDDLDDLELAWAITVHKSQGSEFPAIVLALANHHFKLLQRNLVYTAMTRARRMLCIVGSERALQMAIDHVSGVRRFSRLHERIAQSHQLPVQQKP